MDPHMTREDEELLMCGAHRRLQQRLSPPATIKPKKKKLVNFKISRKGQSDDSDRDKATSNASYSAISQEIDERQERQGSRHLQERKEHRRLSEEDLRGDFGGERRGSNENLNVRKDYVRNLNEIGKDGHTVERREATRNLSKRMEHTRNCNEKRDDVKDISERRHKRSCNKRRDSTRNSERRDDNRNFNGIEMMSCLSSPDKDGNENLPSSSQKAEHHGPILNQTPTATNENSNRRRSEAIQLKTRSLSETSWEKVKLVTVNNGKGARFNNVVEMVTNKRRSSFAPYIWTPSVPRSAPNPRPANFQDQVSPIASSITDRS